MSYIWLCWNGNKNRAAFVPDWVESTDSAVIQEAAIIYVHRTGDYSYRAHWRYPGIPLPGVTIDLCPDITEATKRAQSAYYKKLFELSTLATNLGSVVDNWKGIRLVDRWEGTLPTESEVKS